MRQAGQVLAGLELSLLCQEDGKELSGSGQGGFASRLWEEKHVQEGVSCGMALGLW